MPPKNNSHRRRGNPGNRNTPTNSAGGSNPSIAQKPSASALHGPGCSSQSGTTQNANVPEPKPLPERSTMASAEVEENISAACSVCAGRAPDWAVGQCAHAVCGDCAHRMRVLYKRKTCVMCTAELKQVAVVPLRDYRPGMNFDDVVALPGAFQDSQVDMWFLDRTRCQKLKNTRGSMCSHKFCTAKGAQNSVFANAAQLRAHVRSEHRAVYCEVCFSGKRSFVSEMQLYTLDTDRNYSSRLRGHMRKDHPQCRFCRNYYLDDEKLYAHLQERHETCAICERNNRMHEYYVNYEQLEHHYQKEHYVCCDAGCRGVVFATQIELQTHEHSRHNENPRNARSRGLRVNLQQLHGERDARRRDGESPFDVRREQERQAARRQAFLSSNVVFSGAFNFDDEPPPSSSNGAGSSSQPSSSSQSRGASSGSTPLPSASTPSAVVPRAPDDGYFHPLELPSDQKELQARNTVLVRTMRSVLDPAAYEHFRMSSGQFHSGKISSEDYYDAVIEAFGVRAAIRDILPELVALLPTPLLREPLLRTCMQRTDTKVGKLGYVGPPPSGNSSNHVQPPSGQLQEEQFPTLNGAAPVPIRTAQASARRFGAPGPEEFPRLGRVNKPQGNGVGSSSSVQGLPSNAGQMRLVESNKPAPSSRSKGTQPQKTAASVLRHASRPHVLTQNREAVMRGGSASSVALLTASAFPSLVSAKGSAPSSSPAVPRQSTVQPSSSAGETLPADVSLRAGAVWGGVAGRVHKNGGKRRGPGRGRGRTPASPPKRMVLGSSDFPDIRVGSHSDNASSASEDLVAGNVHQAPVIDVMEIAKSRRKAVMESNLPRVGGSGYGFAWERKKAQQKRRQIKRDVAHGKTKCEAESNSIEPMTEGESRDSCVSVPGSSPAASSSVNLEYKENGDQIGSSTQQLSDMLESVGMEESAGELRRSK